MYGDELENEPNEPPEQDRQCPFCESGPIAVTTAVIQLAPSPLPDATATRQRSVASCVDCAEYLYRLGPMLDLANQALRTHHVLDALDVVCKGPDDKTLELRDRIGFISQSWVEALKEVEKGTGKDV